MRRKARYLYIELKKTAGMFPRMLLLAVVLMILVGGIAFCGVKAMEREPLAVGADIGVVVREDDRMTRMALDYVENMESAAQICRFRQVSEEEGMNMLADGELAALVLLPEGLVDGIMYGRNPSVDVVFPKNARLEAMLFRELTESGAGLLRVAQAQIYGADDTAARYGLGDELSAVEAGIDGYNLAFALDRLSIYDEETVSATGRLSVAQHYASSGIVLFLLLAGMAAYPVMQPEPAAFRKQLVRAGVGGPWQSLCKWLCGLCYMLLLAVAMLVLLWGVRLCTPEAAERLGELLVSGRRRISAGVCMGMLFLVLTTVTSFHHMIYSVSGSRTGSILFFFPISVAMLYLSGGFVPSALLPQTIRGVGAALPTSCLIRACGGLFTGYGPEAGRLAAQLGMYTAAFGAAAYVAERFRYRRCK